MSRSYETFCKNVEIWGMFKTRFVIIKARNGSLFKFYLINNIHKTLNVHKSAFYIIMHSIVGKNPQRYSTQSVTSTFCIYMFCTLINLNAV